MTTLAAERSTADPSVATSLRRLAAIEAKRFARHPLFIVGALMCAALSIGLPGPDELDYPVIPAFFLGLLGLVVAARLTRSTDTAAPVLDAVPVPITRRTAALCLACAVPAVSALLIALLHRATMLADPIPDFRYGTFGFLDRQVITLVLPVVYATGGPLLGVAVGRWLRFPGAPLLTVVGLLAWSSVCSYLPMGGSSSSGTLQLLHVTSPYTAFAFSDEDNVHPVTVVTTMPGAPHWFAVWAVALCGLAVCAALWRGAAVGVRRSVARAAAVVAAVGIAAVALAATGGHDVNHETDKAGRTTVVSSDD